MNLFICVVPVVAQVPQPVYQPPFLPQQPYQPQVAPITVYTPSSSNYPPTQYNNAIPPQYNNAPSYQNPQYAPQPSYAPSAPPSAPPVQTLSQVQQFLVSNNLEKYLEVFRYGIS